MTMNEMMLSNGQWIPMEDPLASQSGTFSWDKAMEAAGYKEVARIGDDMSYGIVVRQCSNSSWPMYIVEANINASSQMYVGAATIGDMYTLLRDLTQLTYHAMMIDEETSK